MQQLQQPFIRRAIDALFSLRVPKEQSVILDFKPKKFIYELQKCKRESREVVIEMGVGKGLFIRNYAEEHPEKRFFGIEKVRKWIRHAASRIEKKHLTNISLIQSTAEDILDLIPDESVDEYYILFPDPWPKRRHAQRRIIQRKTIQKVHATLKKYGRVYIATDHANYFQWINDVILPMLKKDFEKISDSPKFVSNYQIKYEKEGRPIYSLHIRKR